MKNNKGITLIALVITIIVLVILAGVTIKFVIGENGVIGKAKDAKQNMLNAESEETKQLGNLQNYIEETNQGEIGGPKLEAPEGVSLPEDFYYVGGEIETGVIISDKMSDQGKGTSHEVALNLVGNQFVWIPVETPIANSEAELTTMLAEGKLPMAVKQEDGYYRGVLYDVTTDSNKNVVFTAKSYTPGTGNREPDVLTDKSRGDGAPGALNGLGANGTDLTLEEWGKQIKEEYKAMVESVIKYGGFYISRYEISETEDNKIESKANVDAINGKYTWYGIYAKCKNLSKNDVNTGMLWGSQWDQIMIYLKDVKNKNNNKFFIIDGTKMGNGNTSIVEKTGSKAEYQVKGVYNIAGNLHEWTMEAFNLKCRAKRGGNYTTKAMPINRYDQFFPDGSYTGDGARMMLYLNN